MASDKTPVPQQIQKPILWIIFFLVWGAALTVGFYTIVDYMNAPGIAGEAPEQWPPQSDLDRRHRPTLLVFAHPRCPCSSATISELSRLLPRLENKVDVHVVFYHPKWKFPESWVKGGLWKEASRLPQVKTHIDSDGLEISLFRPSTSGQTYLYDEDGKLIFSGGITPGRGHEGDNKGSDAIVSWVREGIVPHPQTFVFGCSLFHEGERVTHWNHLESQISIVEKSP